MNKPGGASKQAVSKTPVALQQNTIDGRDVGSAGPAKPTVLTHLGLNWGGSRARATGRAGPPKTVFPPPEGDVDNADFLLDPTILNQHLQQGVAASKLTLQLPRDAFATSRHAEHIGDGCGRDVPGAGVPCIMH